MNDELINALRRIAKVSYGATIEEAKEVSKTQRDAAALIEQQAAALEAANARIAEFARILDGLPQDAIDGGWTARGISAYAKKLELQVSGERGQKEIWEARAKEWCDKATALKAERDAMMSALAECRDAMPIPDAGAPIEGHWASAMADPLEVPGYIRAALAQPLEAQADARWQPIETAPKDGTPLILFARSIKATASIPIFGWFLDEYGWIAQSFHGIEKIVPSHWMPRPEFPAQKDPQ